MKTTFQYYKANIKESTPLGIISLDRFIKAIKDPLENIKEVFDKIHQAELDEDWTLKSDLKTQLYSFTPAVYVIGRRQYSDIHNFTGLMPLDFDHLENREYAEQFRDYLFNEYPFIVSSWLSASGLGVRALVRIPLVENVVEYKQFFEGLKQWGFGDYVGFDIAPKNAVLPLFLSYDKDIKFRSFNDAAEWNIIFIEPEPEKVAVRDGYVAEQGIERRIGAIIDSAINKIVTDGHPQIRSIAVIAGGYVGSGVVSYEWARDYLYNAVDSNAYLRAKSRVYKKTVLDMLEYGRKFPKYLD